MEFFFPEDNLQRATPAETHITSLTAEPYPDNERVHVNIEITPFQTRPYIEVVLTDAKGDEVATASIVEPMGWKLEFTMHLRGANQSPFTIEAKLFYPDGPPFLKRKSHLSAPSASVIVRVNPQPNASL